MLWIAFFPLWYDLENLIFIKKYLGFRKINFYSKYLGFRVWWCTMHLWQIYHIPINIYLGLQLPPLSVFNYRIYVYRERKEIHWELSKIMWQIFIDIIHFLKQIKRYNFLENMRSFWEYEICVLPWSQFY